MVQIFASRGGLKVVTMLFCAAFLLLGHGGGGGPRTSEPRGGPVTDETRGGGFGGFVG